jgi:hypothetical protein
VGELGIDAPVARLVGVGQGAAAHFATPERAVIFDINDLDETLPAPW